MKCNPSLLPLALLLLGTAAAAQDAPPPLAEAQGVSQRDPARERFDEVGYAEVGTAAWEGYGAAHVTLPPNNFVEVTALDSGKTIILVVTDRADPMRGKVLELSPAAAAILGGTGKRFAVRIRPVQPPPADQAALRGSKIALVRAPAPAPLLTALRKQLRSASAPAPTKLADEPARTQSGPRLSYGEPATFQSPSGAAASETAPMPKRAAQPDGSFVVQIAALSRADRAQMLATNLGGFVRAGNGLYRVQLGPYRDRIQADRARVDVVRRGYADARIIAP